MLPYVFLAIFILFVPVFFIILRAMAIEKYFKPGHVFEIRLAYVLGSIIGASLATGAIERIFSLF